MLAYFNDCKEENLMKNPDSEMLISSCFLDCQSRMCLTILEIVAYEGPSLILLFTNHAFIEHKLWARCVSSLSLIN